MSRTTGTIILEDRKIIFRNFAGEESQYNRAGKRTFCIVLRDEDEAEELRSQGWNVKMRPGREEYDEPLFYLQANVGFNNYPPTIYMVGDRGKVKLNEDTVDMLDGVDIDKVDVQLRPYNWTVRGESGVTAYVKSMYVVLQRDVFANKYADEPFGNEEDEYDEEVPFR